MLAGGEAFQPHAEEEEYPPAAVPREVREAVGLREVLQEGEAGACKLVEEEVEEEVKNCVQGSVSNIPLIHYYYPSTSCPLLPTSPAFSTSSPIIITITGSHV